MATLTNTRIKNTYDGLLKTTDNDALGGTYKLITDGLGNSSNIYLGTGGNLGIGIIPTEKFHVNGDAIVSGDLHVDAIKPIASSNPIKFKNFASTELVRITDSGNVGIGTENPDEGKLQIGDSNNVFNISFGGVRSKIGYNGANTIIQGGTSKGVAFCVNNNTFGSGEVVRIKYSNGYVGIGETDPSKPLTINKNQSETAILVQSSDTGLSGIYLGGQSDSIKGGLILDNSDNSLQLRGYNNANRLHIDSSGNVGIGTTNPSEKLHVNGNIQVSGTFPVIKFSDSNDNPDFTLIGANGKFRVYDETNNVDRFVIDSSGNVGIGTSIPERDFHLHRDTLPDIHITNSASGTTATDGGTLTLDSLDFLINNRESGNLRLFTSATERMRIDSSGNVGIGTSSPDEKLEIAGDVKIQGADSGNAGVLHFGNDSDQVKIAGFDSGGSSVQNSLLFYTNTTEKMRIDSNGNFGFNATSENSSGTWRNYQLGSLSMASRSNDSNPDAMFGTNFKFTTANSEQRISAHATSRLFFNDDVITFQNAASGAADSSITWVDNLVIDSSGKSTFAGEITASNGTAGTINLGNSSYKIQGGPNFGDLRYTAPRHRFYEDTNLVMSIDGGKVGIGTSTPDTILEVVGENPILTVRDTSTGLSSANSALRIAESGSGDTLGNYWDLKMKPESIGGATNFAIANSILGDVFNINYQAKVGIGTSNPSAKFVVKGSGTSPIVYFGNGVDNAPNRQLAFSGGPSGLVYDLNATGASGVAGQLTLSTNGSERMRIDSSGRVGIGTSNPSAPLTLSGDTTQIRLENTATGGRNWALRTFGSALGIYDHTAGAFRQYIDSSGRVGIGTTNPTVSFQVGDGTTDATSRFYFNDNTYTQINGYGLYMSRNSSYIRPTTDNTKTLYIGTTTNQWNTLNMDASTTIFNTNGSENMRITNSGTVLVGKTSLNSATTGVELNPIGLVMATRTNNFPLLVNRLGTDGTVVSIRNDSSQVGSISISGSTTSYNETSDYRLKENVVDLTGALDRIEQLQPKRFNFISEETTVDGFIAHEVQSVIPEAVFGEKDAVDDEGNPEYQGIDKSKIVPLLVGAIKELKSEIETLKSQINS
jgi:hypothetical protein